MYKFEVKKLNDFNQLAKKLSTEYLLFSDGTIIFTIDNKHLSYGEHFGKVFTPIFNIENDQIFCISSNDVFKVISKNKKSIKHINYLNNTLFLTDDKDENSFQIGRIINIKSITKELYDLYKLAINKINDFDNIDKKIISYDIIEKLNAKNIVTFSMNDYKVRLANKLIPLLKKSNNISISFKDINNSNLFESLIIFETEYFNLFHRYMCIKY